MCDNVKPFYDRQKSKWRFDLPQEILANYPFNYTFDILEEKQKEQLSNPNFANYLPDYIERVFHEFFEPQINNIVRTRMRKPKKESAKGVPIPEISPEDKAKIRDALIYHFGDSIKRGVGPSKFINDKSAV